MSSATRKLEPDGQQRTRSGAGPSRREFLCATAASAAVVATQTVVSRAAEGPAPADGFIDAHSHIWTRDTDRYPLRQGTTKADLAPPSFTAEELLETARPHGVRRVVLIAHHTYYGYDNSYLTDAARENPGVFRVVGMVDDQQPHPDRVMKRLLKQHVTGFRITSWLRGDQWLEGPGMAAMWKCAAETGQAICCLTDPKYLASVDRMCEKHPDTPVVIDHFGRVGIDGEIRPDDVKALCRLARHENTYVKVSAFYALGKKQPPYRDLVPLIHQVHEAFGANRLMWASDSPYQVVAPHTYASSLALVRDHCDFLTAEDRQWLLRKTAERVYFF